MKTLHSLLLLFALLHLCAGQGCQAKVSVYARPGAWEHDGAHKNIYNIDLTNTGTCTFTGAVVDVKVPTGSHIATSWGYSESSHTIKTGVLNIGQTYQGTGFVLSQVGEGKPTATVSSFEGCSCPTSGGSTTGLNPSNPGSSTTGSTPTPTQAPTNPPAAGPFYYTGIKFLILTCTASDIRAGVAKTVLQSVGQPYDILVKEVYGNSTALNLKNEDGSGKYAAIVAATELACWGKQQQIEIEWVEQNLHTKTVILYSWPYATNGVALRAEGAAALSGAIATFAEAFLPSVPFYKQGAQFEISGVNGYPSSIVDANLATPALYANVGGTDYVLAAFIHYPDGRRRLEFYVDQADWSLFSALVGTAWLQWASNGVFGGARRIEFNVHVDDIFMATGEYDPVTKDESKTVLYRLEPYDVQAAHAWQEATTARLPAGSNFVMTFPFNMATVNQKGGPAVDALYLTAKGLRDSFFWESHTYTHPYLDNLTYDQTYSEFQLNTQWATQLFDDNLDNPVYSKYSVITPSISGLFNGNALRAMYEYGIRNIVGDNSRPELVPENLYHGFYTTVAKNGYDGIYVIPRHSTNIYYDANKVIDVTQQFNDRYSATLGELTFDQIVARDVAVATKALLEFRHDPFMFHQANLRSIDIGDKRGTSLLAYWTDAVVDKILQYTTLPVLSHTHDDLAEMYHDREARDACGFAATLKYDIPTNTIVGFTATSQAACKYPVTGGLVNAQSGLTSETYGSEKTVWIDMTPGTPVEVTFSTPVPVL